MEAAPTNLRNKIIIATIFAIVAWFIWKPAGVYLAIMTVGYLRLPLQRGAVFWSQIAGMIVGLIIGLSIALLVWILVYFSVSSVWAKIFFGLEGLLATGYIGYGINRSRHFRENWEQKIADAQAVGVIVYLVASSLILAWPTIQPHL